MQEGRGGKRGKGRGVRGKEGRGVRRWDRVEREGGGRWGCGRME